MTDGSGTERPPARLVEDTILIATGLLDAQYAANRYAATGYGHRRDDALDELRSVREQIDETLERYEDTDTEQ